MARVFISYSRKDLAFVEGLASDLKVAGLDVWYDLSGLEGGARWSRAIEKAVRGSQYVLVVLSPDSVASKWVEEEFLLAGELEKKVIPLFYRPCAFPFGYRTLHFVDVQGSKYPQNYGDILRALDIKSRERENAEKIVLAKYEKVTVREKVEQEAAEKAEREAAERAAREKAEREAAEKAAREKVEREVAEKAAREQAEKAAAEKAAWEKAERDAAKKAAREASWLAFTQKIKTILNAAKEKITSLKLGRKSLITTVAIALAVIVALIIFMQVLTPPLFFSGSSGGEINIYSYVGNDITKITQTSSGTKNWSSSNGLGWNIYFTSNRSGKAEIYGFNRNTGDLWQATDTPGNAESWSPAIGADGNLYFTSNRTGKAEIYNFNTRTGKLWQITDTPGTAESWSPAISIDGKLYFTSNRAGKAEIYHFDTNTGELWQITTTPGTAESWSPAMGFSGSLYFTSDRTGKAEIYKFNTYTSKLEQMTTTPGQAKSWGPVVLGKNIYITSNQTGQSRVYRINHLDEAIASFSSWTKKINDRVPGY